MASATARPARRPLGAVAVTGAHAGGGAVGRVTSRAASPSATAIARVPAHRRGQGRRQVPAGGVAPGVQDPGRGVGALAGQGRAVAVAVEGHSRAGQVGHPVRRLGADGAGRGLHAQAGPGGEGVGQVGGGAVAGADGRGEPALRPRGAAVAERPLGHQDHGPAGRGAERQPEPGEAAADDDERLVGGAAERGGA